MDKKCEIIQDPIWGYRRLHPIPKGDELTQFYESQYYDLIRKGGRAPDIRRLMGGGEAASREREWTAATLYADIAYCLEQYASGKRVLDVGCGTGEFVSFLAEAGFDTAGIEPAAAAVEMAQAAGLSVSQATLEEYAQDSTLTFDAITLLDVLEHVPDPVQALRAAEKLLAPGGCICVWVPNDFNVLQMAAQQKMGRSPWWVAIPDHINYFNNASLSKLFDQLNFEVIYTQGDFPMELFLLMGDEYIGEPTLGKQCHWKRVSFELAISAELRRRIYQALAEVGVGRHILMLARKVVK